MLWRCTLQFIFEFEHIKDSDMSEPSIIRSISNLVLAAHICEFKSLAQINEILANFNQFADKTFATLSGRIQNDPATKNDIFTTAALVRLAFVFATDKVRSERLLRLVPFRGKLQAILFQLLHPEAVPVFDVDRVSVVAWLEHLHQRGLPASMIPNIYKKAAIQLAPSTSRTARPKRRPGGSKQGKK